MCEISDGGSSGFPVGDGMRLRNAFVTCMACCSSLEEVDEECSLLLC